MDVRKIITGGQTGADRAALDFALANGIDIGGFVPKGRLAEDGKIADRYSGLIETASDNPAERTELNVQNSDATLVISCGRLIGGSLLTTELAERYGKPFLHIDLNSVTVETAAGMIRDWANSIPGSRLNIAGPRASDDPDIYELTRDLLQRTFG